MSEITRIGVDLAKHVIQVHGVDAVGKVVASRALPRDKFMPWCAQLPAGVLIAMEASSSAHHWARKLVALGLDARIIAAHLVAPYRVRRHWWRHARAALVSRRSGLDQLCVRPAQRRPCRHRCTSPSESGRLDPVRE